MRLPNILAYALVAMAASACGDNVDPPVEPPGPPADDLMLHVPSPDWRDQVVYFILTDRFADGDPTNNDQGAGEFDPSSESHFSGGDLLGIINRLDYVRDMGATAVWITPPVANQWYDDYVGYGGYHGYWARHFKEVDEHYGDLDTYKLLSHELHRRGMYLIQDVVVNHTGNFFYYKDNNYNPDDVLENFTLNESTPPVARPVQEPFHLNNALDPDHRSADIYHFTPSISDFSNPVQEESYQLSDLDDLNTDNPVVREALRDSFGYWIKTVGVDAFRLDTAKFVSHDFWHDFFFFDGDGSPGMHAVAAETGRDDFYAFGEVFEGSNPFADNGEQKVVSYLGNDDKPEIPAVLNFPLHFTINEVFAGGRPTAELSYRLEKHVDTALFPDPGLTPVFIDNHDVARFLSRGSVDQLKQALGMVFTIPGIPVIYQGTEQAFSITRGAMFAGGWNPDADSDDDNISDINHYDRTSEVYRYIKELADLRRANPVLTRGDLVIRADATSGPGLLIYERTLKAEAQAGDEADAEDIRALVMFNTADEALLLANFDTGLNEGRTLSLVASSGFDAQALADDIVVGTDGAYTGEMPAHSMMILIATNDEPETIEPPALTLAITSDLDEQTFTDDITVSGTASEANTELVLVVDGLLGNAISVTADGDGNWSTTIPFNRFGPGISDHTVTAYVADEGVVSATQNFKSRLEFDSAAAQINDASGDDNGPGGAYRYPEDASFQSGQMDIQQVEAFTAGSNLKVTMTMGQISTQWGPPNGFDHVAFNVYIDLPGEEDGATVLPLINANAPENFSWDVAAVAYGWGNTLYSPVGASAETWGPNITPVPTIDVDVDARTVSLTFSAQAMGYPASLSGSKIYITTWDIDGISNSYRPLTDEGDAFVMGGGNATDPLIMDDTQPVLTVP